MCFAPEPHTDYYYHEEVIPARKRRSHHHHHSHSGHHHHHHRHHSHSPRASYSSVSTRSYSTGPRASVPVAHRALSIRSNRGNKPSNPPGSAPSRKGFSFRSLRGTGQTDLGRRLIRIIKSQSNLVAAHDSAGRERASIASQLSEWGEQTGDEAVSDISDKVGVILGELGEQEDAYALGLEEARAQMKAIRDTEKSVQPSRDGRAKVAEDIQRLKFKEPESTRLVVLEQELVRAEAENLVAEAQLNNVTRRRLKQAYDAEFRATIERAEKQLILAKHGRRLIALLDDTPMIPGDARPAYEHGSQARQVLNDAEDDLRDWQPEGGGDEGRAASPVGGSSADGSLKGKRSTENERDETGSVSTTITAGDRMSGALREDGGSRDDRSSQADA
ncbi:related to meiotic expression up-regulated protein 14 [Cephalotrichum gorgonifer]|uniref:Related to meiotic expression up-regulated protein 14 n=1 Tax=Cephalotrichum gorgonifer TaxID=2041049 RepID=A0AAE8MWQ8_9PEZI|nr:related to meiotic expression up-regulated protein 14 [Cephalotrichum gorgonifer]